ncbi:MarR family winged helix-turn-helix transcriptional regulator [Leeia oryzae]|uniref:MarR family winged helix-turn-helix transcriptional regulator n=1 Tax=Leeia oryzae TaxID=356662 RepID=UPI000371B4F1|nr:MarR family transcriptional regulator [Leeia oryzae]
MTLDTSLTDRASHAAAQWRKERPDLDPFPMELLGRLQALTLLITQQHLSPLFARFGLQPGEFDVLATLRRAGAPYRLTPTELYETAMISSGGMTNRIDRLETAGLVTREKHPTDRRGTLVGITDAGLALINELVELHLRNEEQILAGLTPAEQVTLNQLLLKWMHTLQHRQPTP